MSSYLSNLLTQTTSKYNSLRRTLLNNEDDGDTEDDTHICRVLRAYYTEKGRPFPPWLPPDPNDRRSATPQPFVQQNSGYFTSAGGRSQLANVQNQAGSRSSLSDLWDAPAQNTAPMQPQSLRAGRRPMAAAQTSSFSGLAPPQARPLPSQRAGSYQTMQSQQSGLSAQASPPSSSGGGSASERLKAKLYGASRSNSPALSASGGNPGLSSVGSSNPYEQPRMGSNAPGSDRGNPYDTGGGGVGSSRRFGRMG
jgi:hypothetical protein